MDTTPLRDARHYAVQLRAALFRAQEQGIGSSVLVGFAAADADDALEKVDRALAGLVPHPPGLLSAHDSHP